MYEKLVADVKFLEGDYATAAAMYLEGARDGDALASFNYGYCLAKGLGVEKNPLEAKSFFAFARDMRGGEACYNIAMLYLRGEGVPKNYVKAYEYMKISALGGCIEAQLYLGMAYTSGCMFEPDVVFISMIPTHKPEYRFAEPLLDGFVPEEDFERDEDLRYSAVKQDAREAFEWFQRAARHDPTYVEELVAKGKYLYARCYVDGLGTDFDRDKSVRLMVAAGRSGSPEALAYIPRIILLVIILLTASFIFTQSLLPSEVSSSESNGVKGFLATIFPPDTPFGAFVSNYVRKIAHFLEFGALGAELTLYALLFCQNKKKYLPLSQLAAFFVAFIDETLQIFSGRGPMISDVWLDFSGSLSFSTAVYLIYLAVKRIKKDKAGNKNG